MYFCVQSQYPVEGSAPAPGPAYHQQAGKQQLLQTQYSVPPFSAPFSHPHTGQFYTHTAL